MGVNVVYVMNLERRPAAARPSRIGAVIRCIATLAGIGLFLWLCLAVVITAATH